MNEAKPHTPLPLDYRTADSVSRRSTLSRIGGSIRRRRFTILSVLSLVLCIAAVTLWALGRQARAETASRLAAYVRDQISDGLQTGGVQVRSQQIAVASVVEASFSSGDYLVTGSFNATGYGTVTFKMRCYRFGWENWGVYGEPTFSKPVPFRAVKK
jgi:hypothetical protein